MFSGIAKAALRKLWDGFKLSMSQMNCLHRQRRDINATQFFCPRCKGVFESDQI